MCARGYVNVEQSEENMRKIVICGLGIGAFLLLAWTCQIFGPQAVARIESNKATEVVAEAPAPVVSESNVVARTVTFTMEPVLVDRPVSTNSVKR